MRHINLCLPWPPSVNGYWRSFKGRQIISARGRQYLETVRNIAKMHKLKGYFGDCRLEVIVEMYPPDKRKRDIDNYLKCVFDSFSKSKIWDDDEQVDELIVSKRPKSGKGFLQINVREIINEQ